MKLIRIYWIVSVKFLEDNENFLYIENQNEQRFKAIDEETIKIKEYIKKRVLTPYSKSLTKVDNEEQTLEDVKVPYQLYNMEQDGEEVRISDIPFILDRSFNFANTIEEIKEITNKENQDEDSHIVRLIDNDFSIHANVAVIKLEDKSPKSQKSLISIKEINHNEKNEGHQEGFLIIWLNKC